MFRFYKKPVGDYINRKYIWTSKKGKLNITIHCDESDFLSWFVINDDNEVIYNSLDSGDKFASLDLTMKAVKDWYYESYLPSTGKVVRTTDYSSYNKYKILLHGVKEICSKYPDSDISRELKGILKRIDEDKA